MEDEKKGKHKGAAHAPGGHGGGHEEHEGAPEWLISFADNVTLMMGFFVILLAMTMAKPLGGGGGSNQAGGQEPTPEVLDAAIAIREAFRNPVDLGSNHPQDIPLIRRIIQRQGNSKAASDGEQGNEHDVKSVRPGKQFRTGITVTFPQGKTDIPEDELQELNRWVKLVHGHNLVFELRGHNSSAEAYGLEDRGVRISFERARAVGQALVEQGFSWRQLRLTACSDNDRVVGRVYDAGGHLPNQRVEIFVTEELAGGSVESSNQNSASPTP